MARKIGGPGKDTLIGEDEDDVLRGRGGNDTILGNGGADRLHGGGGRDNIAGGDGDDRILGQGGADRLGGGAGGDIIRGGGGADVLFGDAGNNQLIGGKGKDMFALSPDLPGNSAVLDFNYDQGDRILLDVDVNGNGRLNATEYENYKLRMDQIEIQTSGNDSLVTLSATGVATAAEGDDGPILRLAGVPLRGALSELAVHDYGLNAGQEVQVPTNPSRGSNESEATFSPALSANGRFLAVVSQFDLDGTEPEFSSSFDVFVVDQLTDRPVRVNTGFNGTAGDLGSSRDVAISDDGRFVAFLNGTTDPQTDTFGEEVFVKDLLTGQIRPASDDIPAGDASSLSLSANGGTVVFVSDGDAFVSTQSDGSTPIPVPADATSVSLSADAQRAIVGTDGARLFVAELDDSGPEVRFLSNGANPDLSADGRFVVYDDQATGQVVRLTIDGGETDIVSRRPDGVLGRDVSSNGSISDDGRFVAFLSELENLVANDTNSEVDTFVKDLTSGVITRVSVDAHGQQAFGQGFGPRPPSISGDGHFVAYVSDAPNLQGLFSPDPDFGFETGRTVIWSPIDFDLVALPDIRGNENTETVLSIGDIFQSDIAAFGDQDWYGVQLEAGHEYRFEMRGDDSGGGALSNPMLELYDDGGQLVIAGQDDIDPGINLDSLLEFEPTESGQYFVSAEASGSTTGSYTLSAAEVFTAPPITVQPPLLVQLQAQPDEVPPSA